MFFYNADSQILWFDGGFSQPAIGHNEDLQVEVKTTPAVLGPGECR